MEADFAARFAFCGFAVSVGWTAAVFLLMPNADWDTHSFYLMPFPMMLMMPIVLNMASALDFTGTIDLRPRLEIWCLLGCALATSYVGSFLPSSMLQATLLSMFLSVFLWLAMVQITGTRRFRGLMERKIARKLRLSETDPEVKRLANSQDFSQAMVVSALVTVQVWLLLGNSEFMDWLPSVFGRAQSFSPGGARTMAFGVGAGVGHLYYWFSPAQTEIRELAPRRSRRDKKD